MAEINSQAIANTKIKMRWNETYGTEASNIQMGVNAKGAYRGAIVQQSAVADQEIRISPDGDTIVLHRNSSSGICTVVRETATVLLDLSSRFPLSGPETWYVYMTVDYALHDETEGKFAVGTTIPADAIRLATIEMAGTEVVIEDSNIRTDGEHRDKVLGKRGAIVRKMVNVPALPGRTRFQIQDKVAFVNPLSNNTRMSLRGDSNQLYVPLRGSDGGQIYPGAWYDAEIGGVPLGPGSMDADGCYQDPWVEIDFTDTADSDCDSAFNVAYFAYVPLDELEVSDWNVGFVGAHTNEVWDKVHSGTPDSLSPNALDDQLGAILSLINGRIREFHPDSSTSTWDLLWRSNNVVNDADVDGDTLSLYFNNKGILIVQGGYIGNDGQWKVFVPAGSSPGNVFVISFQDGVIARRWKNVSAVPAEMRLVTTDDWDSYDQKTSTDTSFFEIPRGWAFDEYGTVLMNAIADDGGNDKYLLIMSVAGGNIRVYWGGDPSPDSCRIFICFGALWNDSAGADGLWQPSSGTVMDARAISIGRDSIELMFKDKDDADYSLGWTYWSSFFTMADGTAGQVVRKSNMEEIAIVPFKFTLQEEYVRAMKSASYTGPLLYETVNLREKWVTPPSSFSWEKYIYTENTLSPLAVDSLASSSVRSWGLKVSGKVSNITDYLQTLELWTGGASFQKTYTIDFIDESLATTHLRAGIGIGWHDGSGTIVRVISDNGDIGTIEIDVSAGNPPDSGDTLTITDTTIEQAGVARDSGNIYIEASLPPMPSLRFGQTIAVRGIINGAWAIKEFICTGTTRSVIVVDCEGNENPLPDGTYTGNTAYYLDSELCGTEITAYHMLTMGN